jgi:membrane-associated phospholipid phosphatase
MATQNAARLPNHNLFRGLRSPGWFAEVPLVGIMMFLLGTILFGALAYGVTSSPALQQWDLSTARAFHTYAKTIPSPLMEYVVFGFFIGRELIIFLGTMLAVYFWHKRFWREFTMLLIGSGGGALLWYLVSMYFNRPRPSEQLDLPLSGPSFPSGHALSALVFYGFVAYLLIPKMPSRFWKWVIGILLGFVILFVGLSRLLLGGHYVTDVVSGYALGLAWAGLVYTLVERLFPRTEPAPVMEEVPSAGLRSPGWFKQWTMLGVIIILLGVLSFAGLSYSWMTRSPLVQMDQTIYKDLISQAGTTPPRINELMIFGFFMGKQLVLLIVTILSVYFVYKRYWRELAMLLLSSAAGSFVWNYFIYYFARPRPAIQTGLEVHSVPSFPSGHAMSAMICYGFLAYLLIPKMPTRFWKWVVGIVAAVFILFDGFSRIFQGSHYLTDVLAGYALGMAWAGLVYMVIEKLFWKRKV